MTSIQKINILIDIVIEECLKWLDIRDNKLQFVDPLENKEISAHYGATHFAVAAVMYGYEREADNILEKGFELLDSILERWSHSSSLPAFHNDFNNFALCILDDYLHDKDIKKFSEYHAKLSLIVLNTKDSNHDTVNWLPMRWYVNISRYKWTNDTIYLSRCKMCKKKIKEATYEDGFIDDRLPKGYSFNLQYDVATVAIMQLLRARGEEINLDKELGALINARCPDGDINYFGRGTNQIFAWGLWIYLLASSGQIAELDVAVDYLYEKLPIALKNHNIMLNEYPGEEKYMWWDYHYCSVYTAHLLLWMLLASKDLNIKLINPKLSSKQDSGIFIYKNTNVFYALFNGRKGYLAEKGPILEALWNKEIGTIFKGNFGPWYGSFGNLYCHPELTILNYFGFICLKKSFTVRNSTIRKLLTSVVSKDILMMYPVFCQLSIHSDCLIYSLGRRKKDNLYLNLPSFVESDDIYKVFCNQKKCKIEKIAEFKNQYQEVFCYQAKINSERQVVISL